MKRILVLFLGVAGLFALTACSSIVVPGDSYSKRSLHSALLARESAEAMVRLQEPKSCRKVSLTDTKVIGVEEELVYSGRNIIAGHWTEIWTFDKCGAEVKIRIVFIADATGGVLADLLVL